MITQKRVDRFIHAFPKYLLLFTILFLVTIYILVWLIDFKQMYVPGLSEWKDQFPANLFWVQIFREGGIVENLQWFNLGISFILCLLCVYLIRKQRHKIHWGLVLLSIGLLIMFLEDTINIRHQLSYFISLHFYDGIVGTYEWRTSTFRSLVEISVYAILGLLMITAFIKIYHDYDFPNSGKMYLFSGYLFYGIAAAASATRNIGDWYANIGEKILEYIQMGNTYEWSAQSIIFYQDPLSFWFMDLLFEESFELIGSILFCSTLTILLSSISNKL